MKEIVIDGGDVITYLAMRESGYETVWVGEGKICMVKKCKNLQKATCE